MIYNAVIHILQHFAYGKSAESRIKFLFKACTYVPSVGPGDKSDHGLREN